MQDGGQPLQQFIDVWSRLQGASTRLGNRLWCGAASHHIGSRHQPSASAAQHLKQASLLLGTPQIPFVQHQQQPFPQSCQGLQHRHLRAAQVTIHHHQQQVGTNRLLAGSVFTTEPSIPRFKNARGIHQAQTPFQSLQAQAIAGRAAGGSHRGGHITHHVFQQGADQRCFAAGSGAEHHHHKIAAGQVLLHPFALLAQAFPHHTVLQPFEQAINADQAPVSGITPGCRHRLRGFGALGAGSMPDLSPPGQSHLHHQGCDQG